MQILYSCKHSGLSVHAGEQVPPEAKADLENLAQYILRNPFSVEKMTLEFLTDMVIYRSRLNAKIKRNFHVFTATDFLAAITQHIPTQQAGSASPRPLAPRAATKPPRLALQWSRFGLCIRETSRGAWPRPAERRKIGKNSLLTAPPLFAEVTSCLVSPLINSPSPA